LSRFTNSATPELAGARRDLGGERAPVIPKPARPSKRFRHQMKDAPKQCSICLLAYGRAKQWAQARTTADELRRNNPNSPWTMRAFVQLGQRAEEASDDVNANYYYRAAVILLRAMLK
jgi:predicted Zn-dependent protease